MTVTADPQSTPAMNGWAAPQERDPATEIDRLRGERDLARAERDRVTADFESFKSQVATVGEEAAANRPTALDNHCVDPPGYPATSKARPAHRCSSWNESTSGAAEAHEADTPHVPPLGATSRQCPGIRPVCV